MQQKKLLQSTEESTEASADNLDESLQLPGPAEPSVNLTAMKTRTLTIPIILASLKQMPNLAMKIGYLPYKGKILK